MPFGVYTDYKCSGKHPTFTPQEHQSFVRDYFIKSPYKGLLLYHKLGSGKTCSSIIIGDALLKLKKNINKVYVFTPGSLRQGWITEYCGVCGDSPLLSKYTFVTYNYNVAEKLPDTLDDSLVIIDEVHNLINGAKNQSKTAEAIYRKITRSNCKILALSGTPLFNNIYEWSLLGNMLKPGAFPNILSDKDLDINRFMSLFKINVETGVIVEVDAQFKENLKGIISYFPGVEGNFYPRAIFEPIQKVQMNPNQEKIVMNALGNEIKLSAQQPDSSLKFRNPAKYAQQMQQYIIAKKHLVSRKFSLLYNPDTVDDLLEIYKHKQKLKDLKKNTTNEQDLDTAIEEYKKLTQKTENTVFTPTHETNRRLPEFSPKLTALFKNILNNYNSKHFVFTFFKEYGVDMIKKILDLCGVKSEIFSGDLNDKKRESLLKRFNSPNNRHGEIIKVLLVTNAGAEGITLLETGHIHILESDPRENLITQAIGRAIRYKSAG